MTTHDMIVMLCPKTPLYFTSHRGYFLSSQNETHVMMQLCPLNKAKWIFCTRWHFLLLSASKMCTHLLFIVLFWKLKEIWLDLTDTQKRTLTQYSVNNERIRELVLNGGHGSWLTYLPIRLCFLKPQLFFSVLKASQSDKPPLLPPSGWMMLLSRQPWDKPPPPDTLPLFFGRVMSFQTWRQTEATAGHNNANTLTYLDFWRNGCLKGTLAGCGADKEVLGSWAQGVAPQWELTGQPERIKDAEKPLQGARISY